MSSGAGIRSACQDYYGVENAAFAALKGVAESSMVKLVLKGRHRADLRKDIPLLTERLSQRFFFVKTVDESQIFIDYAQYKNDLSERGEFVREVGRYELREEERLEILHAEDHPGPTCRFLFVHCYSW